MHTLYINRGVERIKVIEGRERGRERESDRVKVIEKYETNV